MNKNASAGTQPAAIFAFCPCFVVSCLYPASVMSRAEHVAMDIAGFDEQLIDVITAWLLRYSAGETTMTAFYGALRYLPDPYQAEWHKLVVEMHGASPVSFSEAMHHMAERIPSKALKYVAAAFSANRDELDHALSAILKVLWQEFAPQPKPSLTDLDETVALLRSFTFGDDDLAEKRLLELGDHLLPYLAVDLDLYMHHRYDTDSVFELMKALNTPGAVRHLRRYVESNESPHRAPARQVLRELGVHANAPQYVDFEGYNPYFDLYLKVDLDAESVLQRVLNADRHFQNEWPSSSIAVHAGELDDAAATAVQTSYNFTPTMQLHFDVPHLDPEELTVVSRRTPAGDAVTKAVLRMTFDRLRNTDWDLMLVSGQMGLILMRKSGELLLNKRGFWTPANLEEVPFAYQWISHP